MDKLQIATTTTTTTTTSKVSTPFSKQYQIVIINPFCYICRFGQHIWYLRYRVQRLTSFITVLIEWDLNIIIVPLIVSLFLYLTFPICCVYSLFSNQKIIIIKIILNKNKNIWPLSLTVNLDFIFLLSEWLVGRLSIRLWEG